MADLLASYTSGDNHHDVPDGTITQRSMSFVPNASVDIGSIQIQAYRVGSPGTLTVELYAVDGSDLPTGVALSSGTVSTSGFDTLTPGSWESVTMTAYTLTSGTSYAFVVSVSSGDVSNYLKLRSYVGFGGYASGLHGSYDGVWAQVSSGLSDLNFKVYSADAAGPPSKASNPSPADASGPGISFSGDENNPPTISWTGDGDTYDVYGGGGGNFVKIAEGISQTSYTLSASDMNVFKCADSGTAVQWRVDSINDEGTTTGDTWTFDPRPAKVATPSPATASTGKSISQLIGWAASTYATSYDVWVNSTRTYNDTASYSNLLPLVTEILDWGTLYTWRVDSNNYYGTTEGDEWTFTTLTFAPPLTTHRLLSDNSISTDPFNPVTMYYTGENFTCTMRRLLAFCGSSLWYESIDAADS